MENKKNFEQSTDMYKIEMTSKEVKRLGYNLGYGLTSGVFSAIFMIHFSIGAVKAIKRRIELSAERAKKKEEEESRAAADEAFEKAINAMEMEEGATEK